MNLLFLLVFLLGITTTTFAQSVDSIVVEFIGKMKANLKFDLEKCYKYPVTEIRANKLPKRYYIYDEPIDYIAYGSNNKYLADMFHTADDTFYITIIEFDEASNPCLEFAQCGFVYVGRKLLAASLLLTLRHEKSDHHYLFDFASYVEEGPDLWTQLSTTLYDDHNQQYFVETPIEAITLEEAQQAAMLLLSD